jgi:hypothetical protein
LLPRLHTFTGADKALQDRRIRLAMSIATVARTGIDLADAEHIWALGNFNANDSNRFEESPLLVPFHVEEIDAFNAFLSQKILVAPIKEGKAKAIHYLGVHHLNMLSRLGF